MGKAQEGEKENKLIDHLAIGGCSGNASLPCINKIQEVIESFCLVEGYDSYAFFHSVGESHDLESPSLITMSNYPGDWLESYFKHQQTGVDPIVRCADKANESVYMPYSTRVNAFKVCRANPVGKTTKDRNQYLSELENLESFTEEAGRLSGFYFSHGIDDHIMTLSVTCSAHWRDLEENFTVKQWQKVWAKLCEIHLYLRRVRLCRGCSPTSLDAESLFTKAERLILGMIEQNNSITLNQIAVRLGKSPQTVSNQLTAIRRKVNKPYASLFSLFLHARHSRLF